jgi:ATP adenylyltransferase
LSEEYVELCAALQKVVEILWNALKPGGMNVGMNLGRCAGAGVEDHLHWHLVPRWEGDTNFMPVLSDVRVMPEHLLASYDRLHPFFDGFMNGKHD